MSAVAIEIYTRKNKIEADKCFDYLLLEETPILTIRDI
jgi:hypothetical protein